MNVKKKIQKICSAILIVSIVFVALPSVAYSNGNSTVTTDAVTEVTANSAVLNGHVNFDGDDTLDEARFYYYEDSGNRTPLLLRPDRSGKSFSASLTGLQANKKYNVYVEADFRNSADNTKYFRTGETQSFTTSSGTNNGTTSNGTNTSATVSAPTLTYISATSVSAKSSYKVTTNEAVLAGFVLSTTDDEPTFENSSPYPFYNTYNNAEKSSFTETLSDMVRYKNYYVRAFVRYTATDGTSVTKYSDMFYYRSPVDEDSNVETVSATYEDNFLKVKGRLKDYSTSNIYEEGFVYSSSNSVPTLGDTKYIAHNSGSTRTEFEGDISVSQSVDTYYVRAYATGSAGTSFGRPLSVSVASALPTVVTNSIANVYSDSANVSINVTNSGDYHISERGVVYSKTISSPELDVDKSNYISISGSTGSANVTISGLDQNSRYYVRAYAKNNVGTAYGETREFTTSKNATVLTEAPTEIKSNSIVAHGTLLSENGFTIQEKGFVYAKEKTIPTYDDNKATVPSNSLNSYTYDITNLYASSTYYIRAFVKTSQGISYGDTLTFSTLNPYVGIKISYKSLEGTSISTQEIDGSSLTRLNASHLTIPYGYTLYDANWSYEITSSNNTIAVILKPDTSVERPFMVGTSMYTFSPDTPIKRVEVAEMIYNLQGGSASGFNSSYTDVPANLAGNNAISYVSSKSYMQGYPDGSFKPNNTITRAELAVVLCKVYGLQGTGTSNLFTDSTNHWGRSYINIAAENNIISGYPGGLFKPDGTTTRAEACKLFSSSSHRTLTPLGTEEFTDVPAGHWAYQYIMNAAIPK